MANLKGLTNKIEMKDILEHEIKREMELNPFEDKKVGERIQVRMGEDKHGSVAVEAIINANGGEKRLHYVNFPWGLEKDDVTEFCAKIAHMSWNDVEKAPFDITEDNQWRIPAGKLVSTETIYRKGEFTKGTEKVYDKIAFKIEQFVRVELNKKPFERNVGSLEIKVGKNDETGIPYLEATGISKEDGKTYILSHKDLDYRDSYDLDINLEFEAMRLLGDIENFRAFDDGDYPEKVNSGNEEKTIFEQGKLTEYDSTLEKEYGSIKDVHTVGERRGHSTTHNYEMKLKMQTIEERIRANTARYEFRSNITAQKLKLEVGLNTRNEIIIEAKILVKDEYKLLGYNVLNFENDVKSWTNEKVVELVNECDIPYPKAIEKAEMLENIGLEVPELQKTEIMFKEGEPKSGEYETWRGEKHFYINGWENKSMREVLSENNVEIDGKIKYELNDLRTRETIFSTTREELLQNPLANLENDKMLFVVAELPSKISYDEKGKYTVLVACYDEKIIGCKEITRISEDQIRNEVREFLGEIDDDAKSIDEKNEPFKDKKWDFIDGSMIYFDIKDLYDDKTEKPEDVQSVETDDDKHDDTDRYDDYYFENMPDVADGGEEPR